MIRSGIQDMPESDQDDADFLLPQTRQVTSGTTTALATRPATWPNTYQHPHPGYDPGIAQLAALAGATMHPEMPRIPWSERARWMVHLVPSTLGAVIDFCSLAANSEPDHNLFTAIPVGLGIVAALGTVAAAVAGNAPARTEIDNRDNGATRIIGGASVALLSVGAMMGAGNAGVGWLGAATTLAGCNIAWVGFLTRRRSRNQDVVMAIADAYGSRPLPPSGSGVYVEQVATAPLQPVLDPFESVTAAALDAMGYAGAAVGAPKPIGENAWKIRAALPKGRNTSPERLVGQTDVLASNMQVRRVEIEAVHSNLIEITVFDGPDTLGRDYRYPWDGQTIESLDDEMALFIDEAGRILALTIDDHLLISGKTGGGKSKLVQLILARTLGAKDVVRIGIDCKPGAVELGLFESSMHFLAKTSLDALRCHHGLAALITERGKILEEHRDDTWRPEYGPQVLVASDERAVITRDFPEAGPLIEGNMQMGRFVKVKGLDATQTPSGSVYGKKTDARHQYGIRIGFYNESTVNTMVFGGKASSEGWRLEKLQNAPGKALVRCYGHNVPRPYKALLAEREEIDALIARYDGTYPELDERSAAAFAAGIEAFDASIEGDSEGPGPSGRPRRRKEPDPVDVTGDSWGRPPLHLVRKYPDGTSMNEARALLWDAIGDFRDGFTYRDIVALGLDGYASRSSIQTPLDIWRAKGWVTELRRDGNANVFVRCPDRDEQIRKEA